MIYNTKRDFDFALKFELRKRGVNKSEVSEILSDFSRHFADALADGKTEDKVANELGDPAEIAAGYSKGLDIKDKKERGGSFWAGFGAIWADIFGFSWAVPAFFAICAGLSACAGTAVLTGVWTAMMFPFQEMGLALGYMSINSPIGIAGTVAMGIVTAIVGTILWFAMEFLWQVFFNFMKWIVNFHSVCFSGKPKCAYSLRFNKFFYMKKFWIITGSSLLFFSIITLVATGVAQENYRNSAVVDDIKMLENVYSNIRIDGVRGNIKILKSENDKAYAKLNYSEKMPPYISESGNTLKISEHEKLNSSGINLGWLVVPKNHIEIYLPEEVYELSKNYIDNIEIDTVSGNVYVGLPASTVDVNTVSGNVEITNANGNVIADTVSGNLKAFNIDGNLSFNTVSGDSNLSFLAYNDDKPISREININTVSGNNKIDMGGNGYSMKYDTVSGRMHFDGGNKSDASYDIKFDSVSGDLTIN